jgi:molybdenum cofactor biosynthesis enzyme MoaA
MEIKIIDNTLMMIFLLERCNFSCNHCVRDDEPMYPGYELSFEQLRKCLLDCRSLNSVEWVHFSGGEPTLWREGNLGLVDLLVEISKAGFEPGFTTNGSRFDDPDRVNALFQKYLNSASNTLRLYLSIDTFHRNFDVDKGRSKGLDNVLECLRGMPYDKRRLVNVIVIVVISKDVKSLLPEEMIEHYESLGVKFNFIPLKLVGKAKSIAHLCPDLSSDRPEDLGAYFHLRPKDAPKRTDGSPNMVLIGNDYYLSDPWRKVARLGHLPKAIIDEYSSQSGP